MNTLEMMIPIVAMVTFHAAVFGILYFYFRNRNRERMLMIEKGVDPSIFLKKPKSNSSVALKYGLFFAGLAIGIFFGAILAQSAVLDEVAAYFSMILLFGGAGLLLYYVIDKKNDRSTNG
jgi:hypothetical protein